MIQLPLTILIVDDCLEDRETFRRYLRSNGQYTYRILEAETGAEGVSLCSGQFPDVILLDYMLPDMDGLEVLSNLKTQTGAPNLPVVMLTGQGNEEIAVNAIKNGASDYLIKSKINAEKLQQAIACVLETKSEYSLGSLNSEQLNTLQAITNAAPCILYVYDLIEQRATYYNNQLCTLLGYTKEEIEQMGTSIMQTLVHPDDLDLIAQHQKRFAVAKDGDVLLVEYRMRCKNGEYRCFDARDSVFERTQEGQVKSIFGTSTDISLRKQAESALRETNGRLSLALDAAQMGSWDWNLQTNETIWNPQHEIIFGYSPGTPKRTYQDWADRVHPEDLPRLEATMQSAMANKQDYKSEYRVIWPDGSLHWVAAWGRFYKNNGGEPTRMLGIVADITEKKSLEAQLLRVQRLENLGTLAGGIAHDLNNILTPILTSCQLLAISIPNLSDRHQQILSILESNAKRGGNLIKQILSFARGAEGNRTIVQVGDILFDIENTIAEIFPKSICFEKNIAPDLWTAIADANQLHQVFMNLVVNARDAMKDGGNLRIEASNLVVDENFARVNIEAKVGPYVVVALADTGCGISPEIIERIFDPFFTTKEVGQGTGLGLSTVLGIVKSHEGFITVKSEVGLGSTFKVYLPARAASISPVAENSTLPRGNGEVILVVDDEAAIVEISRTTLETHNYKVIVARDGVEAIAQYAEHDSEISVVLMDIVMPSMDGVTAIRTLQRINPDVKIIATSGFTSNEQLAAIAQAGVKKFLLKPYTIKELLDVLHDYLSKSV